MGEGFLLLDSISVNIGWYAQGKHANSTQQYNKKKKTKSWTLFNIPVRLVVPNLCYMTVILQVGRQLAYQTVEHKFGENMT